MLRARAREVETYDDGHPVCRVRWRDSGQIMATSDGDLGRIICKTLSLTFPKYNMKLGRPLSKSLEYLFERMFGMENLEAGIYM